MNDRNLAYKILLKIEKDKAYSNLTLDASLEKEKAGYEPFVRALVYGVIERKITLDYILSNFLSQPIKKLKPQVLTVLRMGVYQIKFMNKVPVSAAVNESVKLIKQEGFSFASGLVNSVLRKIANSEILYPENDNSVDYLSVRYSCPVDLVRKYISDYGFENTVGILSTSLENPPLNIRVNTLKISPEDLINRLKIENVEVCKSHLENALTVISGNIFASSCYNDGLFHVQDLASQLCINALDPKPQETVLDLCAAPGGKSFTIAEKMQNKGKIYSFDLYEHRLSLINSGAERLGIDIINTSVRDASVTYSDIPKADKILCDVPCSGLGVIRRKPEIKYKDLAFIDKLTDLQYNIIYSASSYLKKGGRLVYSTCSLNKDENEKVCERFLSSHNDFKLLNGFPVTLMPHKDKTDGFFFAAFTKE
ncbi:MAG: 16S rRNA (cytosine(967)-C(5))-methyltransferase RsmB [Oscillospiraceae bacterium]|nr:16S rRNA (cytosine(967)-C(5))-methyltransferase RsmB [Oscillospiraceae bacterium]